MFDPARAPSGDAPPHTGSVLDLAPGKRSLLDSLTGAARAGSSSSAVPGAQPIVPAPLVSDPSGKQVPHAIATNASATADLTGVVIDLSHDGMSPYYDGVSFEIPFAAIRSPELTADEIASATKISFGVAPSTQITSFEGIVRPDKLSIDMGLHLSSVRLLQLFTFVLHLPDGRTCALRVVPWRFRVEMTRREIRRREYDAGTDHLDEDVPDSYEYLDLGGEVIVP